MALSNWDTLAHGPDGKPCSGIFKSKNHPAVVVSIYKNWIYVEVEGKNELTVQHGYLSVQGLSLQAIRNEPQDAVLLLAYSGYGESAEFFGGIGCYGYETSNWIGVKPETKAAWLAWLDTFKEDEGEEFCKWLELVKANESRRFNQGDEYFAQHFGHETPNTPVGQPSKPLIEGMIKKIFTPPGDK